jgi:hypothetical protein
VIYSHPTQIYNSNLENAWGNTTFTTIFIQTNVTLHNE